MLFDYFKIKGISLGHKNLIHSPLCCKSYSRIQAYYADSRTTLSTQLELAFRFGRF